LVAAEAAGVLLYGAQMPGQRGPPVPPQQQLQPSPAAAARAARRRLLSPLLAGSLAAAAAAEATEIAPGIASGTFGEPQQQSVSGRSGGAYGATREDVLHLAADAIRRDGPAPLPRYLQQLQAHMQHQQHSAAPTAAPAPVDSDSDAETGGNGRATDSGSSNAGGGGGGGGYGAARTAKRKERERAAAEEAELQRCSRLFRDYGARRHSAFLPTTLDSDSSCLCARV
jgi:hypothetical protein